MIHITVEGRGLQPRTIHSGSPLCAAERSNNTPPQDENILNERKTTVVITKKYAYIYLVL